MQLFIRLLILPFVSTLVVAVVAINSPIEASPAAERINDAIFRVPYLFIFMYISQDLICLLKGLQ
jgi:hypothetical protein